MHVEAGILMRNSVPHGTLKDVIVDKRHSEYRGGWRRNNKQVVETDDSDVSSAL